MIVLCFSWGLIVVTWNILNFCSSLPPPPSAPVTSPPSHIVIMPLPARLSLVSREVFCLSQKAMQKHHPSASWEIRAYTQEERGSLHGCQQSRLIITARTWALLQGMWTMTGETQCLVIVSSVISLRE